MKSYTQGRNLYGTLTKNTSAANLTFGDEIANDDYRALCAMRDWPWLNRLRTITTVSETQFYNLPYDCDLVREVFLIISTKRYVLKKSPSREHWDSLNASSFSADIAEWYTIFNGQIGIWPKPASSSNTINIIQKSRVIDLSVADYTTGTIVSVANGGTAVVGSGTTWTERMMGRYIRFTYSNTANTGDGQWYEISAVADTTHLTLVRAYGGTAIVAGAATYTIGQMPLLPEAFQDLPWIWAVGTYWSKESDKRGATFLEQHGNIGSGSIQSTGRVKLLESASTASAYDYVIDDGSGDDGILNPNLLVTFYS